MDKGNGGTAWKTLLCWLSPQTAKIGRQLQACASGIATVQIFQTEKSWTIKASYRDLSAWDCSSTLQAQRWPLEGAVVVHPTRRAVPNSQLWPAGGRQSQTVLLIPLSPQRVSNPMVKPTTNRSPLTTEQTVATFTATTLTNHQRQSWVAKLYDPAVSCYAPGGIYRERISEDDSKCCCLSSAFALSSFKQE